MKACLDPYCSLSFIPIKIKGIWGKSGTVYKGIHTQAGPLKGDKSDSSLVAMQHEGTAGKQLNKSENSN